MPPVLFCHRHAIAFLALNIPILDMSGLYMNLNPKSATAVSDTPIPYKSTIKQANADSNMKIWGVDEKYEISQMEKPAKSEMGQMTDVFW